MTLSTKFNFISRKPTLLLLTCLMLALFSRVNAQDITLSVSPDNCMAPTPNSGLYTLSGTLNGKNMYTKGANLRVIWTGSQWEVQGDDPGIGGVSWVTGWYNTYNTPIPPADCWTSSFGCFIPVFTGSVYPVVTVSSISLVNSNPTNSTTVNYLVTFSGTMNSLTASNFSLTTTGTLAGVSISSVTQVTGSTWNVAVNTGTSGDGNIRLDLVNVTGASALICTLPFNGTTYNVFKTTAALTLSAGDIAFTGYNSSGSTFDNFSFVVLKNGGLASGTQIMFTDNGWNNIANTCTSNEGIVLWQATSNIPQFTQVVITSSLTPATYTLSSGSATKITTAVINLSTAGDQVLAFQGNLVSPTFISAIHMNADITGTVSTFAAWDNFSNGVSTSRSAIPNGLTNGTDAIMVATGTSTLTEFDNSIYNCTGATLATGLSAMRASINNVANWSMQDVTTYTIPPSCTFSIGSPLSATQSQVNLTCNGICTGVANVVVSGGTLPYTYAWSPSGGSGSSASSLCAGNYTCTITDGASAVITKTFSITQPSAIVVNTNSQTNVLCNGGNTGAASVSASGGTGTLTYNWTPGNPTGDGTASVSGLTAGTWTCTVTDANSCLANRTFTLTQPTALVTSTAITNVLCNGSSTGSSTITTSGGTGAYTYLWSSAQTTSVITGLNAGVRTCTVTDANGCKATNTVTISQPTAISLSASASNPTICSGSSSTLTANASGGTGTITYTWVGGPTANTYVVSPTSPTTYTVNVLDANNCSNSATVNVTANSCIAASALNFDGTNDYVSVAYAETGTNITHEFWFKTSQANQGLFSITDVNPTPGGFDRDLYLTGGNINAYVWLGGPAETITTSGTNYADGNWHHVAHVVGASVGGQKLYVDGALKASGTASASSFNWNTKILLGYSNTSPGNKYFNGTMDEVRIWSVARTQCEINTYRNCEIPTTATGLMANYHFNQGLDAGSNGTVTALSDLSGNGRNGALTNFALTGATSNWIAPGGVTTGSTTPANLAITVGATVSNSIICNGNSTTLSGTGANTYNWTGGVINATAFSPTITATYTVTGTNTLSGCTNTAVATVTVNNCAPGAALNFDGSNDRVNLGTAITNSLSGGNKVTVEAWVKPTSFSGLGCIVGNYNTGAGALQILLRRSGSSYYEFWVGNGGTWNNTNSIATPTLNVWQHVAATWDGSVASIYVNGVLSGTTTPVISTLGNASGNPVWLGGNTISENFTGDVDEVRIWNRALCAGEIQNNVNGEISTTASGLLANYHFNQGLATGNNTAINTLIDASGNSNTGTLTNMSLNGITSNWSAPGAVSASVAPFVSPSVSVNSGAICVGQSFTISPSGASTYTIQGGNTSVSPSSSTTYTVVGSTNGCLSNVAASSVTVNTLPSVASSVTNVSCNGGTNGTATLTATGGASPYTYLASTGATVSILSALSPGAYSYTVTDVNSCANAQTFTVTQPSALSTTSAVTNALCNGGSGSATITATGGTIPYTYLASNGATVSAQSGLVAGTYNYTVTDANACTKTQALSITEPSAIVTTSAVTNALCNGGTGSATVTATGGTGAYSYLASNGATVSAQSGLMPGSYTYTVTDANACEQTQSLSITEPTAINLSASASNATICAGESSTLTANATGGTGTITYTWVSGPTSNVNTVTPTTTAVYTVDVTDGNNCAATSTVEVVVNSLPTISVNSGAICAGQSFTMTPSGAVTYTYSNGSSVVTPTANATYSVSGTDANGCVSSTDAVSTVTVNALPVLTAVTNNTLLCVGQTATLSVSGAITYTWSTTENTTSVAVSPTVQTTYTVNGTDANGCSNNTTVTQDVSACTGIATLSNDASINVYPNPNNGLFIIELTSTSKVTVMNALGQVVIADTFDAGKHTVNISNESTGVYFVKVMTNNKQQIIKMIKE